ncbi:LysR family transcriptional regulator [Nakamurella sp. A5-74]|uniref:LysR family transcriptional regulator n=1 Tax=Nakamurella sp. A5-74 TaxID=3158264 RepID=A0AAU8DJ16_9ACTN
MLDTHRLRVFRAVVAAGSVGGAATALGYTPSAVSQHLTALQKQTGLTLVERSGRGIVTTAIGRRFAEESDRVLRELTGLQSVADDLRAGRVGRLTLRYIASAGTAWVPPVVATLAREFPDLRLSLRLVELAQDHPTEPDLEVFVEDPALPAAAESRTSPAIELVDEPYRVVVHRTHPFALRDRVPLTELQHEDWVDNDVVRGPCRTIVLNACAAAGFAPDFRLEAHDYPSAIAFVAAGVGITVLPDLGCRSLPADVVAIPLQDPSPRRRVMLSVRPAVVDHPAVRRARELLVQQAHRD